MEIPLKSQPKVSMVNLLSESSLYLNEFQGAQAKENNGGNKSDKLAEMPQNVSLESVNKLGSSYKLARTYSETEANNFDSETGHRLYDDGKIRPTISRTASSMSKEIPQSPPKLYSLSHNSFTQSSSNYEQRGLEDEYIPGLDFQRVVYNWIDSPEIARTPSRSDRVHSNNSSFCNTPSTRESSYLDLNRLHALVPPKPITKRQSGLNSRFRSRFDDLVGTSPLSNAQEVFSKIYSNPSLNSSAEHKAKKVKSSDVVDPETGEVNYEVILNSLPSDFNDLPYSQRKKLVKAFSESIDYAKFSLYAKRYLAENSTNINPKLSRNGSSQGSFTRKSRHGSVNTIAERLLAKSSTDMRKHEFEPKVNVDERGALVMNYVLGKIIGFGAWGTIRECTDANGNIKAVKIVKSRKDIDSIGSIPSGTNNKVLEVFKSEIRIWEKLHHQNILPLIEYMETPSTIFCFTERIYGGTLFELVSSWGLYEGASTLISEPVDKMLEKQNKRLEKVVIILDQITSALKYLHEQMGIVHGDLKLENVLIDDSNKQELRMVLCDFGMSKVYSPRLSRASSRKSLIRDSDFRSRSSAVVDRKPLLNYDTIDSKNLFVDDLRIGISKFSKAHGPALQSLDLTPEHSLQSFKSSATLRPYNLDGSEDRGEIDSNLPHSHIGSLPYASPELLLPSPPPLGPSADIWALGVLLYAMCVGKLPFQHPYEPRLRAMITAGQYSYSELKRSCLVTWIFDDKNESCSRSPCRLKGAVFSNLDEQGSGITRFRDIWSLKYKDVFLWLYQLITGCLEIDITQRMDLDAIIEANNDFIHQKDLIKPSELKT